MNTRLDGITPILSMPFRSDGEIAMDGLLRQIDFLDGSDARAVGFGFGSEITRLTEAETIECLRAVCEAANGRIDVMATVGGGSTASVIRNAASAAAVGANLLMVRPAGGSPEEVIETLKAISEDTSLPLVLQDAPQMTGVHLPVETMVRLVEDVPGVAALKIEAPNSAPKMGQLADKVGEQVSILGGAGGLDFANELGRGVHGTVPFVAWLEMFVKVQRLHEAGEPEAARDHFAKYLPLLVLSLRGIDTALWTFKELLRRKGILDETHLRSPSETIDEGYIEELEIALADLERHGVSW